MADYNWFSDQNIKVACEGLREEAQTWFNLSDRMTTVSNETAALSLEVSAFIVPDPITGPIAAVDLHGAYTSMHTYLSALFKEATDRFDELGNALIKCADWYAQADENSAQDFDKIANGQ